MVLTPGALGVSPSGQAPDVPYSPLYDDVYHAAAGAWAQAEHVFLQGNGLPVRWRARSRFVILETGFGLGNNFLATWHAWRADPERCARLVFISVEKHPLARADLVRVHGMSSESASGLADRLIQAWPPLTAGWHTLTFDDLGGSITLMLGLGDVATLLPSLMASVDAFYLDGFAPAKNPDMWDPGWLSRLWRLAAPESTAATWSAARLVRDALTQAGFQVERAPGFGGKRDMVRARFAPRHQAAPLPGGWQLPPQQPTDRHALVVGGGLAGCASAWALAREGWRVTLLDRHDEPAQEASGNPAGLFHGIVHGEDGIHARAHRAAALATWTVVAPWMAAGRLRGQCAGLLRLDDDTHAKEATALIARLGLPPDYVQWLDQAEAARLSGVGVPSGGWLFGQGGWLDPANYCRLLLDDAAHQTDLRCLWRQSTARIDRGADGLWRAINDQGRVLAEAPTLVLANAFEADTLLRTLPAEQGSTAMPLTRVRGQLTTIAPPSEGAGLAIRPPRLPIAGQGYALSPRPDELVCGATSQDSDETPTVRLADHRHNLAQAALLGVCPRWPDDTPLPSGISGRVGWRATTPDRLPLVGALPCPADEAMSPGRRGRGDQPRLIARIRDDRGGLFIVSGMGSRGITWAALAGRLLAHWVTGSPCPVETDLRDALDPARFAARAHRRANTRPDAQGIQNRPSLTLHCEPHVDEDAP